MTAARRPHRDGVRERLVWPAVTATTGTGLRAAHRQPEAALSAFAGRLSAGKK